MEIKSDKSEILRYLGVKGEPDANTLALIDECVLELGSVLTPRYIYGIYDIRSASGGIELCGTGLSLEGNDIRRHLRGAKKCAVMAATVGIGADNAIRIAQNTDMLRAVILDACATEYIEKLCDAVEDEIRTIAAQEGLDINFRFSPGYGDLPLNTQSGLLRVLDADRKIGVTLTKGNLMTPAKSVTAIIGFTNETAREKHIPCETCAKQNDCELRREGKTCGRN